MTNNFVAMIIGEGFEPGKWYVVSPFANGHGEINFEYYDLEKYIEAVNLGLQVDREQRQEAGIKTSFNKNITVGRL